MDQDRISGYWFDFYNEIFPRVIPDVANDGAALIIINGNSCYIIVNFFRPSGSSQLLLYCWYAALFVVLNGLCVFCVG